MKLISFAVKFRAQMTTSQKGKTDNSLQHYGYVPTIMKYCPVIHGVLGLDEHCPATYTRGAA
jgi:hypothetical protein